MEIALTEFGASCQEGNIYISRENAERLKERLFELRENELNDYYAEAAERRVCSSDNMTRSKLYSHASETELPMELYYN